ncbi:hypothetical protein BDR05DRAFT_848845, partial [Suillus weaverae]
IMPHDVLTHWNSTFNMLKFALEYQQVIDAIIDTHKLGLGKYELEEYEWALIKQLHNVLKILKDATLYFSHSTPNLSMDIPTMNHIDFVFTNGII